MNSRENFSFSSLVDFETANVFPQDHGKPAPLHQIDHYTMLTVGTVWIVAVNNVQAVRTAQLAAAVASVFTLGSRH
jgi:hypothetical protein